MPVETPASEHVTVASGDGEPPITVTAAVVRLERKEANGVFGPMVGLEAQLTVKYADDEDADTYLLSRLVGETAWVQDAHFLPNGFPDFSHGFGARYTKLKGICEELEDVLDRAARDRGLVTQIGLDVPLELPALSAPGAQP